MDLRRLANGLIALGIVLDVWGTMVFAVTPSYPPPCPPPANGTAPPYGCSAPLPVTMESLLAWVIGSGLILSGAALRIWDRRHVAYP